MSLFPKFIRMGGNQWVSPLHITSVALKETGGVFRRNTKYTVEVKLSTQKSEVSGNWIWFSGDQKRCCYSFEFMDKKSAQQWISSRFKDLI